ncbi:uncharacterized protein LOC141665507 [Apium graveolens]|uniref:uncharacterized protein LOC141665507 n=1 Tax=Apium graveolens TaxID=4045 RepID=UPI003D7B952E
MWDVEVISELFDEQDQQLILQIPLPIRAKEDSWYWVLEDKGEFSVKSYYRQLRGESAGGYKRIWKKIWGLKLPGKILILWRACVNVFPTVVALRGKRVDIFDVCTWCHMSVEDVIHTLFSYGI